MTSQQDRSKVAHLLRHFGLGASEAELEEYGKLGYKGAVEKLLEYKSVDEGFDTPIEAFVNIEGRLFMNAAQWWWALRLLTTKRPLQEKLTLFWHDHFATSASKVGAVYLMQQQNETMRQHACGKFEDLLLNVSKDPAMLFWLDNQYNVKGRPNENFAREVMELFTIGLNNYREDDIKEIARAYTGWRFRFQRPPEMSNLPAKGEYAFQANLHDTQAKSVLGMHGNWNGEDICRILANQPQTSRFMSRKLWEWFAYPNPSLELVENLAATWRKAGSDLKTVLRTIAMHPEFTSPRAMRSITKNPVDFVIPPLRAIGAGRRVAEAIKKGEHRRKDNNINFQAIAALPATVQIMRNMGMELFFPMDVDGWTSGEGWITTATMVERMRWADCIYGVSRSGRAQVFYSAWPLLKDDPTPQGVVSKLVAIYDAIVPEASRSMLINEATRVSRGTVTERNANAVAAAVSKLIFVMPEFQLL